MQRELPWTAQTPRRQDALVLSQFVLAVLSLFGGWSDRLRVIGSLAALTVLVFVVPLLRRAREATGRGRTVSLIGLVVAAMTLASGGAVILDQTAIATSDVSVTVLARTIAADPTERTAGRSSSALTQGVAATTGDTVEWFVNVAYDRGIHPDIRASLQFPPSIQPVLGGGIRAAGDSFVVSVSRRGDGPEFVVRGVVDGREQGCAATEFLSIRLYSSSRDVASAFAPMVVLDERSCAHAEANPQGSYYPARPVWDWKTDQVGPTNSPVLNSYTNTPGYGDEPSFVDARPSLAGPGSSRDLTAVSAFGDRVKVRLYAVNSASDTVEPALVSRDTSVRLAVPAGLEQALRVRGYITSSNATPEQVEDTADFVSGTPFRLRYVPGSARMFLGERQLTLPDEVVGSGVRIGSNAPDGLLLPGSDRAVFVEVELLVTPS